MSLYLGGEIFDIYKFSHLFVRQGKDLYTCTCTVHVQYIMDICYIMCLSYMMCIHVHVR